MATAAGNGELLRFITCGSVDDGKSTLIGRLLVDADAVPEDHLHANGIDGDLAQLIDGLHAERAQGITIDVGYRYFTTARRRFVIADTPGHEQYTRNMATGASTADLAVILVDATKGVRRQTYRHSAIVAMMGIRQVVLAINKMDLVGWRHEAFAAIAATYRALTAPLALPAITTIPMSARLGDNVYEAGRHMPWYDGPTLLEHLEAVDVAPPHAKPFRFAVQWVTRHEPSDFRGYAGTLLGGTVRTGDNIVVLPAGRQSRIARIVTKAGDLAAAADGQAVTLTLADDIDVARGDLLASVDDRPPELADQLAAHLLWLDEAPMLPGRPYLMRLGAATVTATVSELKHQLDIDDGTHKAAKQLAANEIGFANLALDRPLPFDAYEDNRDTGGFILIDRLTSATVGAGMIRFPLRRAANLKWHDFTVDRVQRSAIKGHRPAVLWFTGLSGAGKSTIADGVEKRLLELGHHTYTLDGDNVRHGLSRDLGFTDADRVENIRRVIETANLMADAGLIVLISFISPFRAERARARERLSGSFFFAEIFVDTPLAECERRDPKGLYRKARAGNLQNFTGIDSPYEVPDRPDLHLRTICSTVDAQIDLVVDILRDNGVLGPATID